jgi:hypothetical protein
MTKKKYAMSRDPRAHTEYICGQYIHAHVCIWTFVCTWKCFSAYMHVYTPHSSEPQVDSYDIYTCVCMHLSVFIKSQFTLMNSIWTPSSTWTSYTYEHTYTHNQRHGIILVCTRTCTPTWLRWWCLYHLLAWPSCIHTYRWTKILDSINGCSYTYGLARAHAK